MKKTDGKISKSFKKNELSGAYEVHKLIKFNYENDAARYYDLLNYTDSWELTDGMVIGNDYPSNVEFRMSNDFPDFVGKNDFLHTVDSDIVVKQRVRDFFETKEIRHLQFLDVVVKDHRGKKVPEKYWLVNITEHVDCIDQKRSKFRWNEIDEEKMTNVTKLELRQDALKGLQLSRVKYFPQLIIIEGTLAREMKALGFTGFDLVKTADFKKV